MRVTIKPDNSGAVIELLPESGATGTLDLTSDRLLSLIRQLGRIHAQLVQDRPIPVLEGASIDAVVNTRWYVQPGMLGELSCLSFQHPGFGPVGFALPIDQVAQLVDLLSNQLHEASAMKASPQ